MQYSPKLKIAMEEIKEILEKHDISGSVVLHTPGHGEHFMKIDPSYSCAFFDKTPGQEGIRVRSRLHEDHGGDAAKRHKSQEDTVNMFDVLSLLIGQHSLWCFETMDMLKTKFDITSTGGGSSSHTTQNN